MRQVAPVAHHRPAPPPRTGRGERVGRLSGGQCRRRRLARVLARRTPLTLLDEPTSALGPGHAVEVLELVRDVAATGRTIVMVQHGLAAAVRRADRLAATKDGRVIAGCAAAAGRHVMMSQLPAYGSKVKKGYFGGI